MARTPFFVAVLLFVALAARAEPVSLFRSNSSANITPLITAGAGRLIPARLTVPTAELPEIPIGALPGDAPFPAHNRMPASLFSGTVGRSFFAPLPKYENHSGNLEQPHADNSNAGLLLDLIAAAEAGSMGYDAVQLRARLRPGKAPTNMTLGEIYDWITATPGQPHAIGRYQFIPATLKRLAGILGLGHETRFTPNVQDMLAKELLEEAGYSAFLTGELDRIRFMSNLSRIWAGLPLPNGRSHYHGFAGNAASMSWARFHGGMAQIWPLQSRKRF